MTKRINTPSRRAARTLSHIHRAIVTARQSGASAIISLPKPVREAAEITAGDRLLVEWNPQTQRIEISKDTESNRERALYQADNLEIIGDRIRDAHTAESSKEWETYIEQSLWGIVNHLKGDRLIRPAAENEP